MTDDIVTRLREWAKPTVTQDDILDLRQAADEIERLRKELHTAEIDRDYYHRIVDAVDKTIIKAVRGE